MKTRHYHGFTLIELLIVVAIIAILAAIAVPNFLEAQVRSKISAEKADIRSIVTALESYRIDNNAYPCYPTPDLAPWLSGNDVNMFNDWMGFVPFLLTTPVAYMTSVPKDVFNYAAFGVGGRTVNPKGYFQYSAKGSSALPWEGRAPVGIEYGIMGVGPDRNSEMSSTGMHNNFLDPLHTIDGEPIALDFYYDPTNGTVSFGDVIYYGPGMGFEPTKFRDRSTFTE